MADYTPRYRNINSPSACGQSAISGATPSATPPARPISAVEIVHMLAEVGAWGVNLHDNDLVPIDATPAERDQDRRRFQARYERNRHRLPDGDDQPLL